MDDVSADRPTEGSSGGDGGPGRRRWILASVAAGALVLFGAAVVAVLFLMDEGGESTSGRVKETGPGIGWAEGVTPAWMSGHMGLGIPATAESAQAAYEGTSRFDTGILTFTLTRAEAEAYLSEHPPQGTWLEPAEAQDGVPAHDFTHLGLPEPETFTKGIRYGYVCPGSPEAAESPEPSGAPDMPYGMEDGYDTSDEQCVHLHAHAYTPQRTRIYLRAHFEPGISPLPSAPSSSPSVG
ncbi:hypothetical protein ABZW67_17165 [Streptomyces rubiginosohelvolus]|uniref:hypothetical protein n=1 Tax=Streptomyces rubiginosohelvolus TaxID=67362 RepID=UPI0033BAF1D6